MFDFSIITSLVDLTLHQSLIVIVYGYGDHFLPRPGRSRIHRGISLMSRGLISLKLGERAGFHLNFFFSSDMIWLAPRYAFVADMGVNA